MRYAALDKYNLSGRKEEEEEKEEGREVSAAPAAPAAAPAAALAAAPAVAATSSETTGEIITLELPSEALMSALAARFEEDADNVAAVSSSFVGTDSKVATEDDVLRMEEENSEGESELAQVLAFLNSEEANTEAKDSASFFELFGIPESDLDRSRAGDVVEVSEEAQPKSDKFIPDGHFDLTKFTETFDRVARAIGATE